MPKLWIYRGLPGSGKTTLAKGQIRWTGGILAGRDHLRMAMFGVYHGLTNGQENMVTKAQTALIEQGIKSGMDVHVDDMNLRNAYVKSLIRAGKKVGAEIEVVDLTDVPLPTVHLQNQNREKTVRGEVIASNYEKFIKGKPYPLPVPVVEDKPNFVIEPYEPKPDCPELYIVDLDGTLAIHQGRSPYDYSRVGEDALNEKLYVVLTQLWHAGNSKIVAVSGRPESAREETEKWLHRHMGWFPGEDHIISGLYMRADGDERNDAIVKYEIFNREFRDNYDVLAVFDDRNRVVAMWRELGLLCLQVNDGDF